MNASKQKLWREADRRMCARMEELMESGEWDVGEAIAAVLYEEEQWKAKHPTCPTCGQSLKGAALENLKGE